MINSPNLTYHDLVTRYGKDLAFDVLLTMEKTARVKDIPAAWDEEARFQHAVHALDHTTTKTCVIK